MSWNEHKKRINCQLCYPFEMARLEGPSRKAWNSWPVGVQPKLNGERCRFDGQFMLSSTEELIYSVPHIYDFLKALNPPFELDGELYHHGTDFDGDDGIHAIVSRTVNLHPNHEKMQYHVFDIASDEPSDVQLKRSVELKNFFNNHVDPTGPLKLVPLYLAHNLDEVLTYYDDILAQHYEGIVVRHLNAPYLRRRSTNVMKFKPKKHDDYTVVGFTEEHDKFGTPKNRLGTLTCTSDTGDTFNVYSGFDDFLRDELWARRHTDLVGRTITVHYQNIGVGGVPIFGRVDKRELRTIWGLS